MVAALWRETEPQIAPVVVAAAAETEQQEWLARSRHRREVVARERQGMLASASFRVKRPSSKQLVSRNGAARRRLGLLRTEEQVLASLLSAGPPSCEKTEDGRIRCTTNEEPQADLSERIEAAVAAALAQMPARAEPDIHVHVPEQAAPEITVNVEAPKREPRSIRVEEDPETGERRYVEEA